MRNWAPEEIRGLGFDPATGARLPESAAKPNLGLTKPGLSTASRSYLRPEQLLQIAVIEQLRPRLAEGAKLIALNGELPGGSRLFRLWQAVRRDMGYESGTPDLVGLDGGVACFIELKRPKGEPDLLGHRKPAGQLSREQREWLGWAHDSGFHVAVCRSVDEVEAALKGWGLIDAG